MSAGASRLAGQTSSEFRTTTQTVFVSTSMYRTCQLCVINHVNSQKTPRVAGKKDKNAISVYERVSEYDPKQVLTESNFCKVFYQHSTEGWERCDAKHPYYCSFENGTFQNFDSSDTWLKASIKCLKEKGFLSEPKNVSVTVWMPEIRYKTIIRYTEVQDAELCGHLEKGFELNIGNCTNEKKSLCQKGTPTSTTTSTTEVIARSVGTSMSTATPPRSPDKMPSGNKTEDSGTSPVIYIVVSVAAFAIIATSIGTTLFWRKRKHTAAHKERRKKNIINKTYDPAAASSSPEGNIVIYDEAEDIVSYFSNANPRTESNEVMGEENDATSGSRQVGNQESSKIDNVYHKLDLPDDTYDHTSEFNNDRPTSNVYGMRSAGPTENQYGSPDDVPSDDTYNKVSEI